MLTLRTSELTLTIKNLPPAPRWWHNTGDRLPWWDTNDVTGVRTSFQEVGLSINTSKTTVMTNLVANSNLTLNNSKIEQVSEIQDNQTCELSIRIEQTWVTFGKLSHVLSDIPIYLKRKVVFWVCLWKTGFPTREISKVIDDIIRIPNLKWFWASHLGRINDERWTKRWLSGNLEPIHFPVVVDNLVGE